MDRRNVKFLKVMAERAGLEKRIHPHGLRHAHAMQLDRQGLGMVRIQQQLGHSHITTTATYLTHRLCSTEVVEQVSSLETGLEETEKPSESASSPEALLAALQSLPEEARKALAAFWPPWMPPSSSGCQLG